MKGRGDSFHLSTASKVFYSPVFEKSAATAALSISIGASFLSRMNTGPLDARHVAMHSKFHCVAAPLPAASGGAGGRTDTRP